MTTYCTSSDLSHLVNFCAAGELAQEAYYFINDFGDVDTESPDFWTDFMLNPKDGTIYAVTADAPITSGSGNAVMIELEEEDQWEDAAHIRKLAKQYY